MEKHKITKDESGPGSATPEQSSGKAEASPGGRRFGLDLGNPIERESAAFSWLIVVLVAAVSIGAVAKIISPLAAVIWTIILMGIVSVPLFRGLKHQLGSPEDDK
jgi:hypothetical protein